MKVRELCRTIWLQYAKKHVANFNYRLALKANSFYLPPSESIIRAWSKKKCAYCKIDIDYNKSIGDHVVPQKAFEPINFKIREFNKAQIRLIQEKAKDGKKILAGDIRALKPIKNIDDIRYILPCCRICNSKKGAMDILQFFKNNDIDFDTLGTDIVLTILRAQARAYGDELPKDLWLDLYQKYQ